MIGIVERLRFDATRCEVQFSRGVAKNIEEAADEIERLRAALHEVINTCEDHLDAPAQVAFRALQSQQKEDHARSCDLLNGGIKCSCKSQQKEGGK